MSPSGLLGHSQLPKSPKRVKFSPENDFPTTEEELCKMYGAPQASSGSDPVPNGLLHQPSSTHARNTQTDPDVLTAEDQVNEGDDFENWPEEDEEVAAEEEEQVMGLAGGSKRTLLAIATDSAASVSHSMHTSMSVMAEDPESPVAASMKDEDDGEEWEDFDDSAPLDDAWGSLENDTEDWGSLKEESSSSRQKEPSVRGVESVPRGIVSDWSSHTPASDYALSDESKPSADMSHLNNSPAPSGALDLSAKLKSSPPKSSKPVDPAPVATPPPSAEDLLLADLEPDISFSSSTTSSRSDSGGSSAVVSQSKPTTGLTGNASSSLRSSFAAGSTASSLKTVESPAKASTISFAYQAEEPNVEESNSGGVSLCSLCGNTQLLETHGGCHCIAQETCHHFFLVAQKSTVHMLHCLQPSSVLCCRFISVVFVSSSIRKPKF